MATRLVFQLSGKRSDGVRLFARWLRHHSQLFSSCQTALHAHVKMLRDYFLINVQDAVCSGKQSTLHRPTNRRLLKLRQVSSNNSEKTVEKEKSEWAHKKKKRRCPRLQARQARGFVTFNELSLSLVPFRIETHPLCLARPDCGCCSLAGWGWVHNVQSHYHLEHPDDAGCIPALSSCPSLDGFMIC